MPPDSAMEEMANKKMKLAKWLDQNQYTRKGILRYERIFGTTYVSVGGETTTRKFTDMLDMQPGMKVLDIGCGIGGSAFYMAKNYGVDVYGVDLSSNMVGIAQEYRNDIEAAIKHRVQFYIEDAISMGYPQSFYDVVYSRDTILHIPDKESLFRKFHSTLKPGGRILISDYCCGNKEPSVEFAEYVNSRGYHLLTVQDYGKILEHAGFQQVQAHDATGLMIEMMNMELDKFKAMKEAFVDEFSEQDYQYIKENWETKLVRCSAGFQTWGLFTAVKA